MGEARAVESLINDLKDNDPNIRGKAAETLGNIRDIRAVQPLINLLKEGNTYGRKFAAWMLANSPDTRAVEPFIDALDKNSAAREKTFEALAKIGDTRAIAPLIHCFINNEEDEAIKALKKIRSKISAEENNVYCSKCVCRFERYKANIPPVINFTYYACRRCQSNFYLLKGIKKVILLLDSRYNDPSEQNMGILRINWSKRKEPFDFDEIKINDANDFDVEELVMKLKNDMDKKRRKRLSKIPVYLSPNLNLSQAKMNLIKDNFKIIEKIQQ